DPGLARRPGADPASTTPAKAHAPRRRRRIGDGAFHVSLGGLGGRPRPLGGRVSFPARCRRHSVAGQRRPGRLRFLARLAATASPGAHEPSGPHVQNDLNVQTGANLPDLYIWVILYGGVPGMCVAGRGALSDPRATISHMTKYTVPLTEMRTYLGHAVMTATWGDSRYIITR